jgi:hypothetical protein
MTGMPAGGAQAVQAGVADPRRAAARMRRKLTFWTLMIAATLALSEFLAAWRSWRAVPSADHTAAVIGLGAALVAAIGWLGFLLYEVDRAAGRIRHAIGLYEWIIARRGPEARRLGGQDAGGRSHGPAEVRAAGGTGQ